MTARDELLARGNSEEELDEFKKLVKEGLPWAKFHLYNSMIESEDIDLHMLAFEGICELMIAFGFREEVKEWLDQGIEVVRNMDLSALPEDRQVQIRDFLEKVDRDKEGFGEGKV